jgi:MFS family permease
MIRNTKLITASSFTSMFFLGVGAAIIGAAARNIGLNPFQIGLLITVQNIGFMFSVIISGALSDTHEKPRLLFFGSLILAASFFTYYAGSSFLLNLIIMFFIGVGIGSYEGVTDAMLLDIHNERESLFINVNHFFVTFGSLMITLYLVFLQMNWRKSMVQSATAVFLLALVFAFTKLPAETSRVETLSRRLGFLTKQKIVWLLFIATICTVGFEMGSIGILTTYLMEVRAFNQVTSKIGLIVFLTGVGSGRILVGIFTKKEQILRNIMLLFALSTVFGSCTYFIDAGSLTYVFIYLSGMAASSLLPLIITLAGVTYKDMAGTVLGVIKFAIAIGGILIPFLFSVLSKYASLRVALGLFPAIVFLSFLMLFFARKSFKIEEPGKFSLRKIS